MTLACKLTTPELRHRRATVIAELFSQVVSTEETDDGFVYTLPANGATIAQIASFIETERGCCEFFSFRLSVPSPSEHLSLEITGPAGTKEFLRSELGL
jgi:hypothetical protein